MSNLTTKWKQIVPVSLVCGVAPVNSQTWSMAGLSARINSSCIEARKGIMTSTPERNWRRSPALHYRPERSGLASRCAGCHVPLDEGAEDVAHGDVGFLDALGVLRGNVDEEIGAFAECAAEFAGEGGDPGCA